MTLTRRQTLHLGIGACAAATVKGCSILGQADRAVSSEWHDPLFAVADAQPLSRQASLRQRAQAKGLLYGAAGNYPTLTTDRAFAAKFAQECGILVPENELKWTTLRPAPDRFDFTKGDWLARFAQQHNMRFRGHTLVWNQAIPDWFGETVTRKNAEQVLIKHIDTVVKHYAGRVHSWDVVNEAIAVKYSQRSDGLQNSPWLTLLDKNYIEISFRAAAAADPNAMLVYNDTALDYDTPEDNQTRAATLRLLEFLKSRNVPIHALGIQAHLDGDETRFNPRKLKQFLKEVADLGLKILITELDVADRNLPADPKERDRRVASAYGDYLAAVLEEPAVIAVLTWGLSDRYTWITNFAPRSDKVPVRPLPLDPNLQRKLAWQMMARAFDRAPKRRAF